MRIAARTDANQTKIVNALRRVGASVALLHTVGSGFPDLAVGYRGVTYLIEVKDGSLPPSKRRLTADEQAWHSAWRGQVAIAECIDDALRIIGADWQPP